LTYILKVHCQLNQQYKPEKRVLTVLHETKLACSNVKYE